MSTEVTETTLLRGRVRLLQPKRGFRASSDTVFLAAATPVKNGWQVLDIGCGVGSAGLCVISRNSNIFLTGIEIQKDYCDLAIQNASLNNFSGISQFFNLDILNEKTTLSDCFDSILVNPPYQLDGSTKSLDQAKVLAREEDASGAKLVDWVKYAHRKLKQGGYLTMIHRADRLADIVTALTARRWFGSLRILPLIPYAGEDAKRVIVQARKERYSPLVLKSGLVLHEKGGSHTPAARKILEYGGALDLA